MNNKLIIPFFVLVLSSGAGCAFGPPIKVSLVDVVDTPTLYRNKKIEFSGYVVRNEYYGDRFVSWQLIMEENGKRLHCFEEGNNPDVIIKCVNMAEEAKKNNERVSVTGRLRKGRYREILKGTVLEMKTFEYKDYKIDTDFGDYGIWCGTHGIYDYCSYY